jgi:hypothetical protein
LKGGVGALRALPTRSREIDTAFIMKLAVAMDLFWLFRVIANLRKCSNVLLKTNCSKFTRGVPVKNTSSMAPRR